MPFKAGRLVGKTVKFGIDTFTRLIAVIAYFIKNIPKHIDTLKGWIDEFIESLAKITRVFSDDVYKLYEKLGITIKKVPQQPVLASGIPVPVGDNLYALVKEGKEVFRGSKIEVEELAEKLKGLDDAEAKKYLDELRSRQIPFHRVYEKGYVYDKPIIPALDEVKILYGDKGVELYNTVTRQVRNFRKKSKFKNSLRDVVLVAGVTSKKYVKDIVMHTNFSNKKLNKFLSKSGINRQTSKLGDVKKVYKYMLSEGHIKYDIHPFLENRLKLHFEKIGEFHNGVKHSSNYSWRQTGDLPGIHAEVLSMNELLWRIEAKGYKISDELLKEFIGFNRNLLRNRVMIRCGDCNFMTHGIEFIEKFI
ncbi:hypothetical protein SAMN04489761_2822 [Tenacibaculum sp. MAR_2009_124]|uniref:hypothetical protein n=1 Tax=Tenacibaculum sp. MAR_2009_124 TaxID=1250059 RepID=UPI00089AB786|nr:hypothetical protein [Tenacibaculum sp. MAR_2009_124]SEC37695.1 hypothetical protein SAMN04489761_2822 [Tenacibaculum sp. MAR_2009_124]